MLWRHKTQTRIQLSCFQVPVQEMSEMFTNVNTIEEVNAVLAFAKSPCSVQSKLSDDDSLDAMYICKVNTSKPKRCVFADLQQGHTGLKTEVP